MTSFQGTRTAADFQTFLKGPGVVVNEPIAALAPLAPPRSCALQGDNAKAEAAYQHRLTLWKDADPDLPILSRLKPSRVCEVAGAGCSSCQLRVCEYPKPRVSEFWNFEKY
jgi:hypothetical protein